MAIDATYGGRSANSYNTAAEVTSFITTAVIFFDELTQASAPQLDAACAQATRDIESRQWHGSKFFSSQFLSFPRVPPGQAFPYDSAQQSEPGGDFLSFSEQDEYLRMQKVRVQRAHALQTLYRLQTAGRSAHREDQFRGIRSSGRGIKFSESFGYGDPDMVLCPEAWDLLRYYKGQRRLVRGDAGGSSYVS